MNIPLQSIIGWHVYYQVNVEKIFVLVLLLTGHFLVYHRMVILWLDPRQKTDQTKIDPRKESDLDCLESPDITRKKTFSHCNSLFWFLWNSCIQTHSGSTILKQLIAVNLNPEGTIFTWKIKLLSAFKYLCHHAFGDRTKNEFYNYLKIRMQKNVH